ncbi:hypothetical protein BJY01DRAFT_227046 [Aspergillus pseudoustus]|uniref:Uncharacterized protein n=1 Tax=Aspergillus pseudoustus TaxID=1810923 RepID=A0ABR4ISK8_9EURO
MSLASRSDMAYSAIGGLLRSQTSSLLRQSMNSFAQKRNWSTASIPNWKPTPSPELNVTLQRFRETVFIPKSLGPDQQNLIYRLSNTRKLQDNPITVYVGPDEEPYQLRTIPKNEYLSKADAVKAFELMKQTKDWSNFIPLLIGIQESGWRLNDDHFSSLVVGLAEANGLGYVSEALKQWRKTLFTMGHPDIGKRLFFELHVQAQQNGFQGPKFDQAYTLAQQFAQALEEPQNAPRKDKFVLKKQPSIIGVLLELSAVDAINNGTTTGREVLAYGKRLRNAWNEASDLRRPKNWTLYDARLREYVPIYNGMKLALQVKQVAENRRLASLFEEEIKRLHHYIGKAIELAKDRPAHPPLPGLLQAKLLHES